MLTGAQVMVKCLEAEGIKAVFGYPGDAICPFYGSIYDSGIRNILMSKNNKNNPKKIVKIDFESIFGNDGGKQL